MAKYDLNYAVDTITRSLQNAMDNGVERSQLLSLYKSKLFNEELVQKDRRNEVLMAVNKTIGMDVPMRMVKHASNDLLDLALANNGDASPEIPQPSSILPGVTPEYILENQEEYSKEEVNAAAQSLKSKVVIPVVGDETVTITSKEENTMQDINDPQNASTNTSGAAAEQKPAFNTTKPDMIFGDVYVSFEVQQDRNRTVHIAKSKDGETVHYVCDASGKLISRDIVPGAEKAEQKAENVADEKTFMESVMGISPKYLAAAGSLLGAGAVLLKSDTINVGNIAGGVAGAAVSYFGADYLLGEMENTFTTKAIAISAGAVTGAVLTKAGDLAYGVFQSRSDAADPQAVLTVQVPVTAVESSQAALF